MNLLQTTEAGAIGIHAMALMAGDATATFPVARIADSLGVSPHHCSKVMQRLHRAGLTAAVRGPGGGYRLGRPPETISLADILHVIEGESDGGHCLFRSHTCCFGTCLLGDVLRDACANVKRFFETTTLAMVAGQVRAAKQCSNR